MQGLLEGNAKQIVIQLYGVVVTLAWAGVVTWVLLKVIDLMVPLRVTQQQEVEGLDITQHGESLQ
jgi:Amt family ammonium transporter